MTETALNTFYKGVANYGTIEQILNLARLSPGFRARHKRAIAIAKGKLKKRLDKEKAQSVSSQFLKT